MRRTREHELRERGEGVTLEQGLLRPRHGELGRDGSVVDAGDRDMEARRVDKLVECRADLRGAPEVEVFQRFELVCRKCKEVIKENGNRDALLRRNTSELVLSVWM